MTLDPLRFVKFFATVKHGDQKYGNLPYTHHLQKVEQTLVAFGVTDIDLLTAAWLHDSIEDTNTKLKEIKEMFGDRVADLVFAVTSEKGENRKIRNALTYPKIRSVKDAVCLKLADRIANVSGGGDLVKMYAKEHEDFKRALFTPGEYEEMWRHLDNLFFKAQEA